MRGLLGLLAALAFAMPLPADYQPSVKDVMRRVGDYVDTYGDRASIVVATERYGQHATSSGRTAGTRTLVSDFALVYADSSHGWLGFRDVIEVDGRPVADREDRLARVLMGSEGRFDEARRLSDESARFNLGNVHRNFNVPTTGLFFFASENLDRFKFAARRVSDDGTWEIGFKEMSKPTLIRTPDGDLVTTTGTIWVHPEDGVVVRTVLQIDVIMHRWNPPRHGLGRIDVRYRLVDSVGRWLPESMDESFQAARFNALNRETWDTETGHADYSDYRTFQTAAKIKIK